MALAHFSWVIPGKLAGSDLPGGGLSEQRQLIDDIAYLADKGVRMLVSLERPHGPIKKICTASGLDWRYFPISDFGVPGTNGEFTLLVDACINSLTSGAPVCVHCRAGIGRTGMVLACIVGAYLKLNAEKSIATVQQTRPAIETDEQRTFIRTFLSAYES